MHRIRIASLLSLFAVLVVAAPASAQANVAGKWVLTVQSPEGGTDVTAVFAQDGTTVTGALESPMVGGMDMADGKLEGNKLTFVAHVDYDGQMFAIEVSADVEGDAMRGSFYLAEMGSMPFTGKRAEG
jgi:hypothetical protein